MPRMRPRPAAPPDRTHRPGSLLLPRRSRRPRACRSRQLSPARRSQLRAQVSHRKQGWRAWRQMRRRHRRMLRGRADRKRRVSAAALMRGWARSSRLVHALAAHFRRGRARAQGSAFERSSPNYARAHSCTTRMQTPMRAARFARPPPLPSRVRPTPPCPARSHRAAQRARTSAAEHGSRVARASLPLPPPPPQFLRSPLALPVLRLR